MESLHIPSDGTTDSMAICDSSDVTVTEVEQLSSCHNLGISCDLSCTTSTSNTTDYTDSTDSEECNYSQGHLSSSELEESQKSGKHCDCKGCRDYSTSNQPLEVALSKTLHSHHSKEKGSSQLKSYNRKIQSSWYKKYPWITVCSMQFRIFCRLCCGAKQQGLLTNGEHLLISSFINNGFANWKKALQRFTEHERSDIHKEAVEKLAAKSSSVHIGAQLSSGKAAEMAFAT